MPLVPCERCHRHIRSDSDACPFCASATPTGFAGRAIPGTQKRLDRVAFFTFALALGGAACGEVIDEPSNGASSAHDADGGKVSDVGAGAPMYGLSPWDAGRSPDAATVEDGGAIMPMYGAARPDAAPSDAASDDGAIYVMYGQPPPDDAGNVQPPYGVPPWDAGGGN